MAQRIRSPLTVRGDDRLRAGQILRMYRLVLDRLVDPSGIASAMHALRNGLPFASLIASALRSAEFAQRLRPEPLSADDVDRMFQAAFGRPPLALDVAARGLPPAHYAAQLLTAEERLAPTRFTSAIYPEGFDPDDAAAYRLWLADHHTPDEAAQAAIRGESLSLPSGPAVSLVVIGGATSRRAVLATLRSVRAQLCDRFELIAVGNAAFCTHVADHDPAAVPLVVGAPDFAAGFNAALPLCRGTFVFALEQGVRLAADAVFRIAVAAASGPVAGCRIAALIADGDRIDHAGRRFAPRFATGWDPETALCQGDLGTHVLPRTALARAVGGARPDYPGCEWEDLALRVIDLGGKDALDEDGSGTGPIGAGRVHHLPRPLFSVPAAPRWAGWQRRAAAARRIRVRSWARLVGDRLAASSAPPPVLTRMGRSTPARLVYPLPRQPPLVSIIVPTRDKPELLRACLDGLLRRTDYAPLEILVIDNRSEDPRTLAYLARCRTYPNVRVLPFDHPFNWGAINNHGVRAARGEVVVLLNNDTDVMERDWLTELAAQAMRPEIGVVGSKLLYGNGTVQHAGLVFGPGVRSYHRFRHLSGRAAGYRGALAMVRQVSAVTGACLAMRRAVFDEVGGIEERALEVTWSDVDLCFRVRARGYRVICTPFAPLRHLELATRGADDTPERAARAERERRYMLERWPLLAGEDPFFNPNFHVGERDTRLTGAPRLGPDAVPELPETSVARPAFEEEPGLSEPSLQEPALASHQRTV